MPQRTIRLLVLLVASALLLHVLVASLGQIYGGKQSLQRNNRHADAHDHNDPSNHPPLHRSAFRVGPLPWSDGQTPIDESYAGYIRIRDAPDGWGDSQTAGSANIFFHYFPAQKPDSETPPLIIWLQGGPGSSSMIGLYNEMGPFRVTTKMTLERNLDSWIEKYGMLFIDSPAGTGFSYVDNPEEAQSGYSQHLEHVESLEGVDWSVLQKVDFEIVSSGSTGRPEIRWKPGKQESLNDHVGAPSSGWSWTPEYGDGFTQNQAAVSRDICLFLEVFYGKLFPELLQSDLYVAGESYGGKFVPALSAYIDRYNKEPGFHSDNSPKFLIPLQGFIIGDGLTDPFSQIMYYAPHALALGLVSESQAQLIRRIATLSIAYGKQNPPDWDRATAARNLVFEVLRNASGNVNLYDMRKGSVSNDWSNMEKFLHVPQVVASLNVFSTPIEDQAAGKASLKAKLASPIEFWKDPRVYLHMYADVMKSTAFLVSDLLDLKRADSLNPDSFLKVGEHEQEWRVEAENSGMNSWNNYKVLLFQGQFDFRDGIWGSTEWIEKLDWSGQIGYRSAQRKIWSFDGHVAGYVTEHRNLKRVELLQAGHLAPMDQGARAKFMIESFVG